jgi:hypothetical protein
MKMSNKIYDTLKWIAEIALPAIVALYTGIANVWGLPYAPEVATTVATIDAFLGALLLTSNAKYKKENTQEIQ